MINDQDLYENTFQTDIYRCSYIQTVIAVGLKSQYQASLASHRNDLNRYMVNHILQTEGRQMRVSDYMVLLHERVSLDFYAEAITNHLATDG